MVLDGPTGLGLGLASILWSKKSAKWVREVGGLLTDYVARKSPDPVLRGGGSPKIANGPNARHGWSEDV